MMLMMIMMLLMMKYNSSFFCRSKVLFLKLLKLKLMVVLVCARESASLFNVSIFFLVVVEYIKRFQESTNDELSPDHGKHDGQLAVFVDLLINRGQRYSTHYLSLYGIRPGQNVMNSTHPRDVCPRRVNDHLSERKEKCYIAEFFCRDF